MLYYATSLPSLQHAREDRLTVLLGALLRRYLEGDVAGFKVGGLAAGHAVVCVGGVKGRRRDSRGCLPVHSPPSCFICMPSPLPRSPPPPPPRSEQESMAVEAAELATASYGPVMLQTIGRVYKTQADILLGGFFDGGLTALRWVASGAQAAGLWPRHAAPAAPAAPLPDAVHASRCNLPLGASSRGVPSCRCPCPTCRAKGRGLKAQLSAASLALKVYQKQQARAAGRRCSPLHLRMSARS